jgi:DNA-binding CsgD family transcriptional regulator
MAGTFVGRQTELASLDSFLLRACERPCALFLHGEAGIGKKRLWREGLGRAREHGVRVLSTHPGSSDVSLAFAGMADLLAEVVAETLHRLPPPQRRALEIALLLRDPKGVPPDDRAVGTAFLGCLRVIAGASPVLIAVDDIQWLDTASMHALEYASRRLAREPVGLLAAVRTAPDEAEVSELMRAFDNDVEELAVGPMSMGALYELVRGQLDVEFLRHELVAVHELSGGNPFFALELASALKRTGSRLVPGEAFPVPANLRELVRDRLAMLPRPAMATLRFAAALARPTVSVVGRATGSVERTERDLEAAERAGVIELQGDRILFAHPLLASIHLAAAPQRLRLGAHRKLAAAVTDQEERARHLALAAEGADAETAGILADAAEHARSRGALATSAELAEQALRLTPPKHVEQMHDRVLVAAERRYAAGDTALARELLQTALATASAGPERARLHWGLSKITQDRPVALDYCRRALEETGDDELLRAQILEGLASTAGASPATEPRAYARESAALAERLGDTRTLARALAYLCDDAYQRGEGVNTEVFERAVALEDAFGGLEIDSGPTFVYAFVLRNAGEYARARALLERLCERGKTGGDAAVCRPLLVLALVEFETGNWDRAEHLAREGYEIAVQTGRESAEPEGLTILGAIAAARGKTETARMHVEHALRLADERGTGQRMPRTVLCFLELSLENYASAYDALLPLIKHLRKRAKGIYPVLRQECDLAEALVGMGRNHEARALVDSWDAPVDPSPITVASRARGLLAAAESDLVEAETLLKRSVEAATASGDQIELGRSLLALGTVQRRRQRKQKARATLDRALELFEQLGAPIWAERARRELGRIGGRSAPRGELSATEIEIVDQVIAGRSNKEVAQALHLSPKTVEWNLSKIYRRLGAHSRTELAASRRVPR